jgi:cytochrome b
MNASMRIWDLPTRLFHWALVVLIAMQYATGEYHLLDMRWHFWIGYATLALIAFRILWGFFGSQTSRFASFVRAPRTVLAYVKSQFSTNPQNAIGHNALGGWSVLILLSCIGLQIVTGLFASDDIDTDGPLVEQVSRRTVKLMTRLHDWNQDLLLVLIALHVLAVVMHLLLKHDDLIVPMITGRKRVQAVGNLRFSSAWLALGLFLACLIAVAAAVWRFAG